MFFYVCLYLGNVDQGRVTLVCVLPGAEGTGSHRGQCCGCSISLTHNAARDPELSFIWVGCAELLKVKSGGGEHRLCMSNWSIKHLCGAGGDEALWDGLWLSAFGPSSANYESKREPEVWTPFSQLVEHMSHPNKDQLVSLC